MKLEEVIAVCDRLEVRGHYLSIWESLKELFQCSSGYRPLTSSYSFLLLLTPFLLLPTLSYSQPDFTLRKVNDSLYWLRATENNQLPEQRNNDWQLPYPVYQFQTGDVDGDGQEDAMVGVIKSTRFYPEKARRLFIFKLVRTNQSKGRKSSKVRPLWLGSKLGGILEDFRFVDGKIRALESTTDSLYVVSDYKWSSFGMAFDHYLIKGTDKETAIKTFSQ